ncbi:YycH family regulatory protein [Metabacillus herbersteinensis]|uniref:YycH family regulatory protein n=1 Tax=Metabacillus herbersteinensis TaxID=283816 RepID=A0ABV6GJK9_9BACI
MNKENVKSVVLTILVLISILLTWGIWTFQPSYEEIQSSTYFENEPISVEKREVYQAIKPQQIYFHEEKNHYSSFKAQYLKDTWKEIRKWEITGAIDQSNLYSADEFLNWVHGEDGKNKVEIVFSDEIPMKTFQSILNWETDGMSYTGFDRMIIPAVSDSEEQKIYFVSYDEKKVIETKVDNSISRDFIKAQFTDKEDFYTYNIYEIGEGNSILLPEGNFSIKKVKYLRDKIDGEKFKQALFSNPSRVRREISISKNTYTDGTRVLNVFPNRQELRYVNPTIRNTAPVEPDLLIEQSIGFLNNHGGWTDDYHFFNLDEMNQEVSFRLSINSIPVFESFENGSGPTVIRQIWGRNEIAIYERPLYSLSSDFPPEDITLPSGDELLNLIKKNQQIQLNHIQNIFPAYELGESQSDPQLVEIIPIWCLQMRDGSFVKLQSKQDVLGGGSSGLE